MTRLSLLTGALALLANTALAETTMTPMTGGPPCETGLGNCIGGQPEPYCFPYQRLEIRNGVPVCVERERR